MNKLRLHGLVLLAAFILASTLPAVTTRAALLLTPDEAKQIHTLIDTIVAVGFPDAQKSVVYFGKLTVSATYDPAKTAPPLPTSASNTQMTNPSSSKVTYGFAFEGLHFKLADGSWIISMAYHFKPAAADKVNFADAKEINLATLTADAAAAHPFDAEKNAAAYLTKVPPANRERSIAGLNKLAPITMYLKIRPDDVAPATVLLTRAGWEDGPDLALVSAEQRARNYWQMKPWMTPDPRFDPTGEYPSSKDEEAAWHGHAQFIPEPPTTALRRALFRWCRAEISVEEPEDALMPLAAAVATTKAAVDPKDPQNNTTRIEGLSAGAKLPVTPAAGADLATRLQSWEARPRMPRMTVSSGAGVSINTSFLAPVAAYTPDKKDLDGLVALLADERPSRFWDFSGPRTVGDNAWRAVATLVKADPRTLAGYPTDHPWTSAERKAAAAAVQTWWKTHRAEFVR